MLKYRHAKGRNTPFLTCDACHKPLEEISGAGVVYRTPSPGAAEGEGEALLAHKGPCIDALEQSLGRQYEGWEELGRYLAFAVNNLELGPDDIAEILQLNRETGF